MFKWERLAKSMASPPPPVVRDLCQEAGEHLRALGHYSKDHENVLFIKSESSATENEFLTLIIDLRENHRPPTHQNIYSAGELHASLKLYEQEIIVHIYGADTYGIVLALNPAAGTNLLKFIESCTDTLDKHLPYEVADPDWDIERAWYNHR